MRAHAHTHCMAFRLLWVLQSFLTCNRDRKRSIRIAALSILFLFVCNANRQVRPIRLPLSVTVRSSYSFSYLFCFVSPYPRLATLQNVKRCLTFYCYKFQCAPVCVYIDGVWCLFWSHTCRIALGLLVLASFQSILALKCGNWLSSLQIFCLHLHLYLFI